MTRIIGLNTGDQHTDGRRSGGVYPYSFSISPLGEMKIGLPEGGRTGVYAVPASSYRKSGQWSATTITVQVAPAAACVVLEPPMHGTAFSGYEDPEAFIQALQAAAPLATLKEFRAMMARSTATGGIVTGWASLEERGKAIAALYDEADESAGQAITCKVSVSYPSRSLAATGACPWVRLPNGDTIKVDVGTEDLKVRMERALNAAGIEVLQWDAYSEGVATIGWIEEKT